MRRQAGGVARTYRAATSQTLASLGLAISASLAAGPSVALVVAARRNDGVAVVVYSVCGAFWLVVAWLLWSQRTTISAQGILIKRGFRGRLLPWDEIISVEEPGRWSAEGTLAVTTSSGDRVALHVPGALRGDLSAYAELHRLPASHIRTDAGES